MERNPKLGKASRALFVVSLVLGIVMLILSALAIALAAFRNGGQTYESLDLQPIDDTASTNDNQLRLVETASTGKLWKRSE
jgi:membrane carboxypeptidase/penicillin-binding protein